MSSGVCLVMSESGGNTAAKGRHSPDGSYDYGLFQVSVPHDGSWVRTQPRRELQSTFFSVLINAQLTKESESFSLLTGNV